MFPTQFHCGALLCSCYCVIVGPSVLECFIDSWWLKHQCVKLLCKMLFTNCPTHMRLCLRDYMFTRLLCRHACCILTTPRLECVCTSVLCRSRVGALCPVKAGMDPDICNPALNKWPDNGCVMNVTMRQTRIVHRWKQSKAEVQRGWPSLSPLWCLVLPRDKTLGCSHLCFVSCMSPASRNLVGFTC